MSAAILVVDDDPQVLKLFGRILVKAGYTVRLAPSGERALSEIRDARFDLVVLDLSMPEIDGFDLLKEFRTRLPELRIIVVSGYLDGALLEAAGFLGAKGTLAKTDAPTKLLETVREIFERFPPTSATERLAE